jgi:relaxase/mobilisation nuclease domain
LHIHSQIIQLAEKDAPDKKAYQKQHLAEYQLHDSTLRELSDLGIQKLPSQEKLQKQIQKLENELAAVQKEHIQLQANQRTLRIVQSNFFAMFQDTDILPELSSDKTEPSI